MGIINVTLSQHIFTSSKALGGYFTIRVSKELDNLKTVNELESSGSYKLPDQMSSNPSEEERKTYPVQLNIYRLGNGKRVFSRSVYRGRDNHSRSGRYGNYYAHSLILSNQDENSTPPYAIFQKAHWKEYLTLEDDVEYSNELDRNIELQSIEIDTDPSAWFSILKSFFYKEQVLNENRLNHFTHIIDFMLSDAFPEQKIVIADDTKLLNQWLYVLIFVFPVRLYKNINFTSFSAQPENSNAHIICTINTLDELSDRNSKYFLIRTNELTDYTPKSTFSKELGELIQFVCTDANDDFRKYEEWQYFYSQINNENTIDKNLNSAIEFFVDRKNNEDFTSAQFIELDNKHYYKKKEEIEQLVLQRNDSIIRVDFIKNRIKTRKISQWEDINRILTGLSIPGDEFNDYVFTLNDSLANLSEIEKLINSLYPLRASITNENKDAIQSKVLSLLFQFGKLSGYNPDRMKLIEGLDSNNFSELITNNYQRILNIAEKLYSFKNSNSLDDIVEKLAELLYLEPNDENFLLDVNHFCPDFQGINWYKYILKNKNTVDFIRSKLPNNLQTRINIPSHTMQSIFATYATSKFDDSNTNFHFKQKSVSERITILENLPSDELREAILRKVLYDFQVSNPNIDFFSSQVIDFLDKYKDLGFSRRFFVENLREKINSSKPKPELIVEICFEILSRNSQNHFKLLPDKSDVSPFYNFLKSNMRNNNSEKISFILLKYEQHYSIEDANKITNFIYKNRTDRINTFRTQLYSLLRQREIPLAVEKAIENFMSKDFNYEDWVMILRILENDIPGDGSYFNGIYNYFEARVKSKHRIIINWFFSQLIIALFIGEKRNYLNIIQESVFFKHYASDKDYLMLILITLQSIADINHNEVINYLNGNRLEEKDKPKRFLGLF